MKRLVRYHTKSRCPHISRKPVSKWNLWRSTNGNVILVTLVAALICFIGHGYAVADVKTAEAATMASQTSLYKGLVSPIGQTMIADNSLIDEVDLPPDPIAKTKWEEFTIAARKVSKIYNFPVNVVLAQGALESAHGRSNFCQKRNNCLGIGAYDSNPDNAFVYENMEQSVVEYMRLIRQNFPEAWAQRQNPDMVIFRLKYNSKHNFYASDSEYVGKVKAMPEWKEN